MRWMLLADALHAALAWSGAWLAAFAAVAAPAAVSALWQGVLIALALTLSLRLAPRLHVHLGAGQRFALWAAAFVIVAGLPFAPAFARSPAGAVSAGAPVPAAGFHWPQIHLDDRWAFIIAAFWLAASLVRAAELLLHSLHLRRMWKAATPVDASAPIRQLLAAASPARRPIEFCVTRELDRPSVIGFFAPRILIPDWLLVRLTPAELEQVVLHESQHLSRRDDWTNLLQKLALVLFPLNPALIWIESRLCREREMACDEGVVRHTRAPRAYAACLASLAERGLERRRSLALALGAFQRRSELVRRVACILARGKAMHPVAARLLAGAAACALLVVSVALARCPQMVAFVPVAHAPVPPAQAAQNQPPAPLQPAFSQPAGVTAPSGYRAVQAKAILPAGRSSAPQRVIAGPQPALAAYAAPRPVLVTAEAHTAESASISAPATPSAAAPQWIVLTAWEEVQTAPRNARIVADYDVDQAPSNQSAGALNSQTSETPVQITVTRLIFAVLPAAGDNTGRARASAPASAPKPARNAGSLSAQPPAPMPPNGWLVFQL